LAYRVSYKSSVAGDLKRLDKGEIRRILVGIEGRLPAAPRAGKALKGEFRGCFRYRFGDYRVIYTIVHEEILILRIGNRKDVYR
jgi:mRNA interferase RelE/StbE